MRFVSISIVSFVIVFFSCKKESFITSPNASISISRDTIKFDTVFATAGSVTQSFKIRNDNDQRLRLDKIRLMGSSSSPFRLNINGNPVPEENNIELAPNDSLYVFVSVYVDPGTASNPFILRDSVQVSYNGNERFVQLEAFGQNANYLRNKVISTDTVWTNDLPFVILGSLTIDTSVSLTMQAGCRVFAHADAPILVDGTLIASGAKMNEVVFAGDRLDPAYRDLPGSWPGIYFRSTSADNVMNFAIIRNGSRAINVEGLSSNSNPKLTLNRCIINNAFEAGIYCYGGDLTVTNSLIYNCGNNVFIEAGGEYEFTNNTIAGYSNNYLIHSNPGMQITNAAVENGSLVSFALNASFTNCIFWGDAGSVDNEVVTEKEGNEPYNILFSNCLYRAVNDPANANFVSVIRNQDPAFDSIDVANNYYDFRVTRNPGAPGINSGTNVALPTDLDDLPRSVGLPDLGSYEKQ